MEAEPIIRGNNEANVWMQAVLASLHGTAGALTDDVARRACIIGDTVLEGFRERCARAEQGNIMIPRPQVPPNMRGAAR